MDFELVGAIRDTQRIAAGRAIRGLPRLRKRYGMGRDQRQYVALMAAAGGGN